MRLLAVLLALLFSPSSPFSLLPPTGCSLASRLGTKPPSPATPTSLSSTLPHLPPSSARRSLILLPLLSPLVLLPPPSSALLYTDPTEIFSIDIPSNFYKTVRSAKGDLPTKGKGRRGSTIFTAGDLGT